MCQWLPPVLCVIKPAVTFFLLFYLKKTTLINKVFAIVIFFLSVHNKTLISDWYVSYSGYAEILTNDSLTVARKGLIRFLTNLYADDEM